LRCTRTHHPPRAFQAGRDARYGNSIKMPQREENIGFLCRAPLTLLPHGTFLQLVGRRNHNLWNRNPKLDVSRCRHFCFVAALPVFQRITTQRRSCQLRLTSLQPRTRFGHEGSSQGQKPRVTDSSLISVWCANCGIGQIQPVISSVLCRCVSSNAISDSTSNSTALGRRFFEITLRPLPRYVRCADADL
jgi:hypothetical protein